MTKIDQDIKFVDIQTWNVYEQYEINNQIIKNQIGSFDSEFNFISATTKSFEERRSNFHGYRLKAMTEEAPPFISIDISTSTFDEESSTFDVTESVEGIYHELFNDMQKLFNFSATLHKRFDGKWGPTIVLENGSVSAEGIVQSITSGFAEMIVSQ